jgi:hypothetical protein
VEFTESLSLTSGMTYDRVDGGLFQAYRGSWRLRPGLVLGGGVELFSGPEDSAFGLWRDNDRALASLEYTF